MKTLPVTPYNGTYNVGANTIARISVPPQAWAEDKLLRFFLAYTLTLTVPPPPGLFTLQEQVIVAAGAPTAWGPLVVQVPAITISQGVVSRGFNRFGAIVQMWDSAYTPLDGMIANLDNILHRIPVSDPLTPPDFTTGFDIDLQIVSAGAPVPFLITIDFAQAWLQAPYNLKRLN